MIKTIHDSEVDWASFINEAEKNYKYQPTLTAKLDNHQGDLTETNLLEIVLWKTNRYPELSEEIIAFINDLRKAYSKEKATLALSKLLSLKGFDLPMASTVLRFACPEHLQIIDQRVYRFINAENSLFKNPYSNEQKVKLYFNYINQLHEICDKYGIEFSKADRILYQLDKDHNGEHPIKY